MISLANLRDKLTWRRGGVLLALLAVSALAVASDDASEASSGRVAKPVYQVGKGECVRDDAYMKRHHMDELKHHRKETMRQGIRTKEFSLQGCVDCHADKKTHSVLGKGGFCQSCHAYAAVTLDCFECHSSKPKAYTAYGAVPAKTSAVPLGANSVAVDAQAEPVEPITTGGTSK